MSEYTLFKISDLGEYTVEPDPNDVYLFQHIFTNQTPKIKHSTFRSFFLSTTTDSTSNANFTLNDNFKARFGTDNDGEIFFDGTTFKINSITSDCDISVNLNPLGISTEFLRFNSTNKAIKVPPGIYFNSEGTGLKGLHFESGEIKANQLFTFEAKVKLQNNIIAQTNTISYSGDDNVGLHFDSSNYAYFGNRLYADDLFIANGNALFKGSLSNNGTGGMTINTAGDVVQTGNFTATKKIYASDAANGIVEAKLRFMCNNINGLTIPRVVAAGQTVTITGGIITGWTA